MRIWQLCSVDENALKLTEFNQLWARDCSMPHLRFMTMTGNFPRCPNTNLLHFDFTFQSGLEYFTRIVKLLFLFINNKGRPIMLEILNVWILSMFIRTTIDFEYLQFLILGPCGCDMSQSFSPSSCSCSLIVYDEHKWIEDKSFLLTLSSFQD